MMLHLLDHLEEIYGPVRHPFPLARGLRGRDANYLHSRSSIADTVTWFEIFEPVFEPQRGLSEIRRVLKIWPTRIALYALNVRISKRYLRVLVNSLDRVLYSPSLYVRNLLVAEKVCIKGKWRV